MDPRQQLEEVRDFLLWRIKRDNETLKHILLAIGDIDRPRSMDPDDDIPPLEQEDELDHTKVHHREPLPQDRTSQEKQQARLSNKTPFKNLTLKSAIMIVLKSGPITSRDMTEKLIKGGWKSDAKDEVVVVRTALSRMRNEIKHEKVNGVLHYSLLPLKELM